MCNKHLGLKRVNGLAILKKSELPCHTKKENMGSTGSALDEIVSSFWHEFLSVYARISIRVGFFHLLSYLTY